MSATANSLKILILVEDEFYRELITRQLRLHPGFQVTVLSNAQELATWSHRPPHLVVLDDRLSGSSAPELLTVTGLNFPDTYTVVLSADADSAHKLELMKLGASEVIARDDHAFELLDCWVNRMMPYPSDVAARKSYTISGSPSVGLPFASSLPPFYEQERTLEDYTMEIIQQYLARYNNNVVQVARKLGVGKSTIYRYLKDNKLQLSGTPSTKYPDIASNVSTRSNESASGFGSGTDVAEKTMVESLTDTAVLTDLRPLYRLYKGNRGAVAEMIEVFLRTTGHQLETLKKYQAAQDAAGILKCLYNLKPTVESMGMQQLKSAVVQAKLMVESNMDWKLIESSISDMTTIYNRCVERLQEQRREIL